MDRGSLTATLHPCDPKRRRRRLALGTTAALLAVLASVSPAHADDPDVIFDEFCHSVRITGLDQFEVKNPELKINDHELDFPPIQPDLNIAIPVAILGVGENSYRLKLTLNGQPWSDSGSFVCYTDAEPYPGVASQPPPTPPSVPLPTDTSVPTPSWLDPPPTATATAAGLVSTRVWPISVQPATPDPFVEIDNELTALPEGWGGFSAPDRMIVNQPSIVAWRVSLEAQPPQRLLSPVVGAAATEPDRLRVGPIMRALLKGSDFAIVDLTEEDQAIEKSGVTEWQWSVTPLTTGNKKLHLSVAVRMMNGDREVAKYRDVQEKDVVVDVDPQGIFASLRDGAVQALVGLVALVFVTIGTIAGGVGTAYFKRRAGLSDPKTDS